MLDKAAQYARNARQAVALASAREGGEDRDVLLSMAETWLLLAQAAMAHTNQPEAPVPTAGTAGRAADDEPR